jgi:hypothetical protein
MTTQSLHSAGRRGIAAHWHGFSRAEHVSRRERRTLVHWLRRTAAETRRYDPIRQRYVALRYDRICAVWADLLEIATILEQVSDPDPGCVAELRNLLSNGCDSPLYNSDVHISELRATLYYVRSRLAKGALTGATRT